MTPVAVQFARVLLEHHRQACQGLRRFSDRALITYGQLCERAGHEDLTRASGTYLGEVAVWCAEHGYPPLNALVVSKDTRMPGDGYNTAHGCSLLEWPAQAEACMTFGGYPQTFEP